MAQVFFFSFNPLACCMTQSNSFPCSLRNGHLRDSLFFLFFIFCRIDRSRVLTGAVRIASLLASRHVTSSRCAALVGSQPSGSPGEAVEVCTKIHSTWFLLLHHQLAALVAIDTRWHFQGTESVLRIGWNVAAAIRIKSRSVFVVYFSSPRPHRGDHTFCYLRSALENHLTKAL